MHRTIVHKAVARLTTTSLLNWLPDRYYLRLYYWSRIARRLDLKNPQTFNEKLQWLKLHNRRPEYTAMVDKYEVKQYVAQRIGEDYIIPTLGVWDRFEDIDFDNLPDQFVLKCTHDSGGLVIVRDKSELDRNAAKEKINRSLKKNYYYYGREWPYKNVKPRILAEQYMSDQGDKTDAGELTDYKFLCFHGSVGCIFTVSERFAESGLKMTFFDKAWNKLPFERLYPMSKEEIAPPQNLEKMIALAERLAKGHPFLRVDFYEVMGKIYFGELTFFPGSGVEPFDPESWDRTLGEWLDLSQAEES